MFGKKFLERLLNPKVRVVSDPILDAANRKVIESDMQIAAPSLRDIIRSIKEGAERGEYGSVIGVDTSGRIPAMMVGSAINVLSPNPIRSIRFFRGRSKQTIPSAPGVFIERSLEETEEAIATRKKAYAKAIEEHPFPPGKILIVDDVLEGGTTLIPLIEVLREKGYEVELAIMDDRYTTSTTRSAPHLPLPSGEKIVIHGGNNSFTPPRFTGEIAGFSKTDKDATNPYAITEYEAFGSMHIHARTLARELGRKIVQEVLAEK